MGFDSLVVFSLAVFLTARWLWVVRSLEHRNAIARNSVTGHTSLYDRARPRPRLSESGRSCLCKCYDSIDNMVEATCLWVWDFTTHKHLDLWADDEDPSQLIIRAWMGCPSRLSFPRVSCTWPCLLRQVGMALGSPYDWIEARIKYRHSGPRQTWYQSRTVCRTIKPWSKSILAFYSYIVTWV